MRHYLRYVAGVLYAVSQRLKVCQDLEALPKATKLAALYQDADWQKTMFYINFDVLFQERQPPGQSGSIIPQSVHIHPEGMNFV